MKVTIVSDSFYPSRRADTEVTINTAAALGSAGADVTLLVPFLWKQRTENVLDYYSVPPSFRLLTLPAWPFPDKTLRFGKIVHGISAPFVDAARRADVFFSRNLIPLFYANALGTRWAFETYRRHAQELPWLTRIAPRVDWDRNIGAVTHGEASRRDLIQLGFSEQAVVVARPGVNTDRFEPRLDVREARRSVGLETEGPVVSYIGNIQMHKGMDTLIAVAALLPEVTFLVVGGSPDHVGDLKRAATAEGVSNVKAVGHQPAGDIARWLYASDILFLPATFGNVNPSRIGRLFLRPRLPGVPLKIYSYLAAGRPIVAADQTISTELLEDETNSLLFPPRDPEGASAAIQKLLRDRSLAARLAGTARARAEDFTYQRRAEIILSFFERRLRELGQN